MRHFFLIIFLLSSAQFLNAQCTSTSGQIQGAGPVCQDNQSITLSLVNNGLGSIQWLISTDSINYSVVTGETTPTLVLTNLQVKQFFRVVVKNDVCQDDTTLAAVINVDSLSLSGSITADSLTVCAEVNNTLLKLGGSRGTIQWFSSVDGTSFSLVDGVTDSSYTAINLTQSTFYKSVVKNGVCNVSESEVYKLSVDSLSLPGSITADSLTVCAEVNNTLLKLGGSRGTIQWFSSVDGTSFSLVDGVTDSLYTAVNLTQSTQYKTLVKNGVCSAVESGIFKLAVDSLSLPGSVTADSLTVCAEVNNTLLKLGGSRGTIQWFSSVDGTSFNLIDGVTDSLYTAVNLTQSTQYKTLVKNGVCSAVESGVFELAVDSLSLSGSITADSLTVCAEVNNTLLKLGGSRGTIQWFSSVDGTSFSLVDGVTDSLYTAVNLTQSTQYKTLVKNGVCGAMESGVFELAVDSLSLSGSITADSLTVCAEVNNTLLKLGGSRGTIQWFSSVDGTSFSLVDGVTDSLYTAVNLTQSTQYKTLVKNGVCGALESGVFELAVDSLSLSGSITADSLTVCVEVNNTLLKLGGSRGTIQWFSSVDGTTFNLLEGVSDSSYTAVNITQSTFYKSVVKNGVCNAVESEVYKLNVDSLSLPGSITADSLTVCAEVNNTLLKLGGSRGTIQWFSSVDGTSFSLVDGVSDSSYTAVNLTQSTRYKTLVKNGVCGAMESGVFELAVDSLSLSGSITSASDTVCAEVNNTLLKLGGSRGTIQWFSSVDGTNFNLISGFSDSSYLATNLMQTLHYKVNVKNGVCSAIETSPIVINVTPVSLSGEISGAREVCNGINTSTLTLGGNRGSIQWQSSSDNISYIDLVGEKGSAYSENDLTADKYFRVIVKNGLCEAKTSVPVMIKVNPLPEAPQAIDAARCLAGTVQLDAVTASGSISDWYAAAAGGIVLAGGSGTNQFNTPVISASTTYFAQSRNLQTGCLSASRTPITAKVDVLSLAGSIAGAKEVCAGSNNTQLILSGHRGVIQWQSSTDNTLFNDIAGANQISFNAIDLNIDTYFRAVLKNGVCAAVQSPGVKMLVSQPSASGVITGMKAVCAEKNATVLRVTGTNGNIQWQSSINRTIFNDIVGATADSLQTLNLLRTTYYRVVVKNGVCINSTSPDVTQTVNPLPPAPVTEDGTRCGTGQVILKAFSPTGISNVIDWYADSIRGSSPALKINNTLFVTPDVIGTKYYYAESRNRITQCVSASRVAALAEIIPFAKTGAIAGDTIVCAGINETGLKISGHEGRIQWQMSTDNINFADILNAKSDSITALNLNQTHYYRVLLNADNGCNPSITDTFSILAPQPSFAGTISGVQEVCSGADSIALILSGFVGNIQWQSSVDSVSFTDINLAADSILQLNRLTQSTFYRVKLISGICTPDTGDIVKIMVNGLPAAPVVKDVINCRVGPVELNAISADGSTTDWFALPVGGEIVNRGQSTGSYITDTLNSTAFFYVQARNLATGCLSPERTKVTALFDPAAIPTISGDPGLCKGDSLILKTDQVYGLQWLLNGDTLAGVKSQSIVIKQFGDYKVVFTNTSGCNNESVVKTVLGYPDILGNFVKPEKTDICDGYALKLSANGSFAYQWYMNGVKVTDSISDTYNARIAGTYALQYISDKGCKVMDPNSISLRLIKTPDAKYSIGPTTCINLPVEFINKSVVTESGIVAYNWEFGNGKKDTGYVMQHIYDKPGLYMTRLVVTPASCLMLADTALLYVKVESPLPAIRYPAVNAVVNKAIALQARDFGSKYQWFPATGLSSAVVKNPLARLTQQQDYRIAITTTAGCTTTDSLLVRVFRENDIMVPEGFSPNSDGQNDKLYPFLIGIKQMNMFRVYDRWGNLIYDNKLATSSTGWDGFFKGSALPAGPYVWMSEGVDVDDKVIRRTGTVMLIR